MTQKKGEIENILKITSPGPVLLRRGSQRDIYLTRSRDQIIVDIEKRDVGASIKITLPILQK